MYVYRGSQPHDDDRERWEALDLTDLASEQICVAAAYARHRRQESLEATGLTLKFASPVTERYGGPKGLAAALAEADEVGARKRAAA